MDKSLRTYLSEIGRRGGKRSRRVLGSETAARMVRVREAKRAFKRFHSLCFWSYDPNYSVGAEDIPWVAEQLKKHGNREAWNLAARLCR